MDEDKQPKELVEEVLDFYGAMEEEEVDDFIAKWMPVYGGTFKEMIEKRKEAK